MIAETFLLTQLLAYMISLAASLRADGISEARKEALLKSLEEDTEALAAMNSRRTLEAQLNDVGGNVAKVMATVGVENEVERVLWQLLEDPAFRQDFVAWLTSWDHPGSEHSKDALLHHMQEALTTAGASPARIETFSADFFTIVDNLVFENAKLARWRHSLALQSLKEDHEEILRRLRERDGDYSPERLVEAIDVYREKVLALCDIIDLAGMPEDDRHVAMQDFVLRQLYIPLRLEVASRISSTTTQVEEPLAELDFVRTNSRLGASDEQRQDSTNQRLPLGDLLSRNNRLVVLADPGGGKSTLMRWMATAYLLRLKNDPDLAELPDVQSLPEHEWLPIVVRCRDLPAAAHHCDLDDLLLHALRASEIADAVRGPLIAAFRARLEDGTLLIMIDGLDEIPDPMLRARFCRRVEVFATIYSSCPMIVTSRIVGYREMRFRISRGFWHATISDLTTTEMDLFAQNWTAATESKKPDEQRAAIAKKLSEDIHSNERVERLAGNPMLLTTLALVHRKIGRLPQRRVDLYREAVQVLLNWRREIDEPLDWQEAVPQVQYVAYAMCSRGVQQLLRDDILQQIEEMRGNYRKRLREIGARTPEQFLELLERRSSILVMIGNRVVTGREVPVYEFRHLTFQEYLAALALVDGRFPGHDSMQRLPARVGPLAGTILSEEDGEESVVSESWREALRLCIAACNDDDVDSSLLAIVRPTEPEDAEETSRPRAVMGALCLADEPNVSDEVAEELLDRLVTHVSVEDGVGQAETVLAEASIELSRSTWAEDLATRLAAAYVRDFPKGDGRRRGLAGLLGMVDSEVRECRGSTREEAMVRYSNMLRSADMGTVVRACAGIMHSAFSDDEHNLSELSSGLVQQIGVPKTEFAAAWALWWLSGGYRARNAYFAFREERDWWKPTSQQFARFVDSCENADYDAGGQFMLLTLGNCRAAQAIDVLQRRKDDEDERIAESAVSALTMTVELSDLCLEILEPRYLFGRKMRVEQEWLVAEARRLDRSPTEVREAIREIETKTGAVEFVESRDAE